MRLFFTATLLLLLVARGSSTPRTSREGSDELGEFELVPLLEDLDAFYRSPPALPKWVGAAKCAGDLLTEASRDALPRRYATEDALLAQFHVECFEKRPCLLRGWAQHDTRRSNASSTGMPSSLDRAIPFQEDSCSVEALEKLLGKSSGSWLLEELSDDKRLRCHRSRSDRSPTSALRFSTGCGWRDRHRSTLPKSYFSGPSGQRAFASVRGSLDVQRDVVLGDTRGPREAEEELADHLSILRRSSSAVTGRRRSPPSSSSSVSAPTGAEWLALATRWNQTLILRDADGRDRRLWALGQRVQSSFAHSAAATASTGKSTEAIGNGPDVGVSLYFTPPGCQSTVPPHLDTMDVFALQCEGRKVWTLTVPHRRWFLPSAPALLPLRHDTHFHRDRGSRQPLSQHVVLHPGDVLYIPRGVIHNTSTAAPFLDDAVAPCWGMTGEKSARTNRSHSLHASIGLETEPHFTVRSLLEHATRWSHRMCSRSPHRLLDSVLSDVLFPPAVPLANTKVAPPTADSKPMCLEHKEFLVLSLRRALLHALSQHIVPLRRSAIGNRTARSTAAHAQLVFDSIVSLLTVRNIRNGEEERQVLAASRRWKQLLEDALGTERTLRETHAWWWPLGGGSEGGEPDHHHHNTMGNDEHSACPFPPDYHTVASFLKDTAAVALSLRTAVRVGDEVGDARRVLDQLTVSLFGFLSQMLDCGSDSGCQADCTSETPLLSGCATDCSSPTLTAGQSADCAFDHWVESGMQQLHEDRIAFAEWLDINDRLLSAT